MSADKQKKPWVSSKPEGGEKRVSADNANQPPGLTGTKRLREANERK